jgi:hypothetical protein
MPSLYNLALSQQYLDLLQTNAKMDFECRLVRGLPDGFYPAENSFAALIDCATWMGWSGTPGGCT